MNALSPARRLLNRIPNKREFLARTIRSLGILQALEQFARGRPPKLLILTYHRIASPGVGANPFYDPVISATPDEFRTHIELLASRYRIVALNELEHLASSHPRGTSKPPVMITFDDAYRDNFEVALPILSRYGAPATFFVPTLYLDSPGVPWWDLVAYIIKSTHIPIFTVERSANDPDPITIKLGANPSDLERTAAITSIIAAFLNGKIDDESRFLVQLARQAHVSPDSDLLGQGLFMGWNQVRQLVGAGMAVGSHGQSHRALAQLDVHGQRQELEGSKRRLEAALDREVTALAYPFGWQGTFTAQTLELARDVGYRWGFSSLEGINPRTVLERDALALRRLNIGTGDSALLLRVRLGLYASMSRSII